MTTNDAPRPSLDDNPYAPAADDFDAISTMILEYADRHDADHIELTDAICAMIPPLFAYEIRIRLDLCPIHHHDIDICFDDDLDDCRPFRRANCPFPPD